MDGEKKYKEALERAKAIYQGSYKPDTAATIAETLQNVFPELKESEDERIRKELITHCRNTRCITEEGAESIAKWIAWLEKQKVTDEEIIFRPVVGTDIRIAAKQALEKIDIGKKVVLAFNGAYIPVNGKTVGEIDNEYNAWLEKQSEKLPIGFYYVNSEGKKFYSDTFKYGDVILHVEKQDEQKPVNDTDEDIVEAVKDTSILDMVEPKFKVGDWIVNNQTSTIYLIKSIRDDKYCLWPLDAKIEGFLRIVDVDSEYHLWTIQDAKNGDVLVNGSNIFIFKDLLSDGSVMSYCDYDTDSGESDAFCPLTMNLMCSKITPATKEQRNLLFQKMKEESYVWDAEKKELSPVKLKAGQVLKHDNLSVLCLGGRNAVKCNGEPFVIQYPDEWIEVYGEEYDKFFTRLQSSGYYYDFLHNQVKENCSTLWVARDFDGALAVFTNRPVLTKSKNRWIDLTDKNDFFSILPEYYYPKVTFENSPLQLFHL